VSDPLLATVRELEQRDAALAEQIDNLVALERAVAVVRTGAEAIAAFGKRLPAARAAAAEELEHAETEVARRTEVTRGAQTDLERARDDARADAERALATAEASLRTAMSRLGRARVEVAALEREAAENEQQAASLADQARVLAERIGERPEEDVERWGARARARVFADRTYAEAERQRLIAEAAELGSVVVGEPLAGSNVSAVRRRVEAALSAR
jgi:chromosome segregation ATPase